MNTWFTSDLHFGHERVARIRGFSSTEDHDTRIFDNWCSLVQEEDRVWVLGDLAVSIGSYRRALEIIRGLPGTKFLVWGNHDPGHPLHRTAHKDAGWASSGFAYAAAYGRIRINKQNILLSHFPYTGDHGEDRYSQYRFRNEGLPIIHGHTHSRNQLSRAGDALQIHVGVDAWDLKPVPISTITAILDEERNEEGEDPEVEQPREDDPLEPDPVG